ncbi:MAG TPA: DUF4443 domain-containing protein [Candidatus Bathyarchaeia archaeon]|nr:DUF4443 domain-containing protein [Candidatus Bathyarchaeia archaeon]
MKLLEVLEGAAGRIAPGKAPYLIEPHIVKALATISTESPIGRISLAKTLGLGEGTMRTLIKHLERAKLIETSREGIVLTATGQRLVSNLQSRISAAVEVPRSSLTVSAFNMAVRVKGAADAVRAGLEQRDAAIKVGAHGATTLVFKHGSLTMPSVKEDILRNAPKIRESLLCGLKPEESDVVVIGSGDDKLSAEYGAIAAALETLKAQRTKT